jgi:hypothetical protein
MRKRLSNEVIQGLILALMKEKGPQRVNEMVRAAGVPYERTFAMLHRLTAEGVVEEVPGGIHRNMPVAAWRLKGDSRGDSPAGPRLRFSGAETLGAMQAVARSIIQQGAVHA